LEDLFKKITIKNDKLEIVNRFKIILCSHVQSFKDLGKSVSTFETRLEVRPKGKINEVPKNQPQQQNNHNSLTLSQPAPQSQQQPPSIQMNQQPISQPVQGLNQQMQQLSTSQQPSRETLTEVPQQYPQQPTP